MSKMNKILNFHVFLKKTPKLKDEHKKISMFFKYFANDAKSEVHHLQKNQISYFFNKWKN